MTNHDKPCECARCIDMELLSMSMTEQFIWERFACRDLDKYAAHMETWARGFGAKGAPE